MKIKKLIAILSTGVMLSTAAISANAEEETMGGLAGCSNCYSNGTSGFIRSFDNGDGSVYGVNHAFSTTSCEVRYHCWDVVIEAGVSNANKGTSKWNKKAKSVVSNTKESPTIAKGNNRYHHIVTK